MGRFFSGGSASKSNETEKSPSGSNASFSEDSIANKSTRSPSTAAPATLLKDIISIEDDGLTDSSEVTVDTAQNSRVGSRLRYLSPSALDQRSTSPSSRLQIDVDPEQDVFFSTPSAATNRKRQLTELDRQAFPQTFRSESVKRSRVLNRSLLEPTVIGALPDRRLDRTWNGELTANNSPASSVTNFSMLSRRSGATTNGSLSTRTQEIFKKLEGTNTPAKEVQRMSMIRAGLTRPERWALNESRDHDVSSISTPPPPLKKAGDAIPSRIQLISKSIGSSVRRTPYWTDLTRKRTISKNGENGSSETSSLKSLNGTFASAELCSVFSLEPPVPKKTGSSVSTASTTTINSSNSRKPHVSILKGPDGKPVSRNTFKLTDDSDEDEEDPRKLPSIPEDILSNPPALKPAADSFRTFLTNLSFDFTAPRDVVSAVGTAKSASVVSSVRTSSDSKEVDSDNNESTEKQESSSSESDDDESERVEAEAIVDEVKESRPQTSADTISSAEGSNPSGPSSKDSSPKTVQVPPTAVPENWTCQECFLSWDQSKSSCGACGAARASAPVAQQTNWTCQECFTTWDPSKTACGACGVARSGSTVQAAQPPAAKQLVSNLKDFAPKQTSNFTFGFGAGTKSAAAAPATSATIPFGITDSTKTKQATPAAVPFGVTAPITEKPTSSLFGGAPTSTTPAVQPVATAPVAAVPTPATEGRVDWNCPDCCVPNKATDDKCVCCSHVKYASAESSSNVFGNRAFKPASTSSNVQFGVGSSSAAKPPVFGFGVTKTSENAAPATSLPAAPVVAAPVAPTTTKGFPFSNAANSVTAAETTLPKATTAAPLTLNPIGSLFIVKAADSTAPASAVTASVTPAPSASLFGNNASNLFGALKTDISKESPPKPSIFGSFSNKDAPTTTAQTAQPSVAPSTTSLFGSSTTATPFGGASSMFSAPKSGLEVPKPASTLSFGSATSTTNEALKPSIFGSLGSSTTAPAPAPTTSLFGSASSSSSSSMFLSKPADSTTSNSIFSTNRIQFPSEVGTTSTDGGVAAKRGNFAPEGQKLMFGGEQKIELPKFGGFGGSAPSTAPTTTGGLFGSSTTSSMFGGPSSNAPSFTSSTSTTVPAFGSSSTVPFGGATSNTGFGSFGGMSSQPGISTSSSTNSLFGQAPADSSNPFRTTSNSNFNFGASSSTGSTGGSGVFQFGGSAPTAPAPTAAPSGPFQFNSLPAPPPGMDNAFSYQAPSSVAGRKLAMARRRNVRK
uniref:RanBP2-type domain-containing protein n=1 Tax=Caenorhabditis tropicalis TaxID=1561998 RepID=A0A1I7U5V6_9PELO